MERYDACLAPFHDRDSVGTSRGHHAVEVPDGRVNNALLPASYHPCRPQRRGVKRSRLESERPMLHSSQ